MTQTLPISILEPSAYEKRRRAAGVLGRIGGWLELREIKSHLREVREYALANHETLLSTLESNLNKFPEVGFILANDAKQAVDYIRQVVGSTKNITVNQSSVVTNELKPSLKELGFNIVERYFGEFKYFDKKITEYWQLPNLDKKGIIPTCEIVHRISNLNSPEIKDYVAILGVNAISANDCSVFFLEHLSNIFKDLKEAKKVILVVGLDKIVKDRDDALFQTKCMGIFGLESILLDIKPKENSYHILDEIPALPAGQDRELHIILLDDGRSRLLEGDFHEMFLCIDCRACIRHCPIGRSFSGGETIWSPKNYLFLYLLGENPSVDACIQCQGCLLECPLEIDIPKLMWKAQLAHYAKYGRPIRKRALDNPEMLAKLGTLAAPLSNRFTKVLPFRITLEKLAGVHRKGSLPTFHRQTFRGWLKKNGKPSWRK